MNISRIYCKILNEVARFPTSWITTKFRFVQNKSDVTASKIKTKYPSKMFSLRLATLGLLYFVQGAPYGFQTACLPIILREGRKITD